MSETKRRLPTFEEMTTNGPESTDPDYLAWRDAKVRRAIEEADRHPERSVPIEEVRKLFGL